MQFVKPAGRKVALGVVLWITASSCWAATTNTVPWEASFETYTNGFVIDGTNGWVATAPGAAEVTTNPAVVTLLTNYPSPGIRSYPLPLETHDKVLKVSQEILNETTSLTGGVIKVDFLAMPVPFASAQPGDSSRQMAFYVYTNGHLVIWHRDTTLGNPGTNRWLELMGATINTGVWSRFTVKQDYASSRYQVSVNEGDPLTNAVGWTLDGEQQGGSWFNMVQTNKAMTRFRFGQEAINYVDDVKIARRSLSWVGGGFVESVTNNGAMDNGTPIVVSVLNDTFNVTNNEDMVASGKVIVSGLTSNLEASVRQASSTQVWVTITGAALQHESSDDLVFSIHFTNTAFSLGNVWDVETSSQSGLTVTFSNTPSLSYGDMAFIEAAANDGSISNDALRIITLVNGQFSGIDNSNLAADTNAVRFTGLPVGLTGEVIKVSDTQVRLSLRGRAAQNDISNNVPSGSIIFGNNAFVTVPASSVFHSTTNFGITFTDPASVNFGSNVVTETIVNDGTLNPVAVTLVNRSFDATNNEDLVLSGKVQVTNYPAGMGVRLVLVTDQEARLEFTGSPSSNGASASITNLTVTFLDGAFVGGNAAGVVNYTLPSLTIQFMDPRIVTWSGTNFTESSGGYIYPSESMSITLTGETFTGNDTDEFYPGKISVSGNLPSGLVPQATRMSSTSLRVRLTGRATSHGSVDNVSNVVFTLQDTAFVLGSAQYVENYVGPEASVTFGDETGFFNIIPYAEPFEGYTNGYRISGTNGWLADYAEAAVVTSNEVVNDLLTAYQVAVPVPLPINTNHTKTLFVQSTTSTEIHSQGAPLVYVDFLTIPVAMGLPVDSDTNRQCAFYVSTNGNLVIWHRNMTGGGAGVPEWLTLDRVVSTSQWARFTVAQDYTSHMFQVWVDGTDPLESPAGWTKPEMTQPGNWFYMVQTNSSMTRFKIYGLGEGYLDDLTVRTTLPTFNVARGSAYRFR